VPSSVVASLVVVLALVVVALASVHAVQPQQTYVVELLGRYRRTLRPGVHVLIPFIESVRAKVNMREQVASFPPQPAITSDDLVACIDTVLYYRVVDPVRGTYEIANYIEAMDMLTTTILRNLMGSMELEQARSSAHEIAPRLTKALNERTASWGIDVIRVEIKAIGIGSRTGCP